MLQQVRRKAGEGEGEVKMKAGRQEAREEEGRGYLPGEDKGWRHDRGHEPGQTASCAARAGGRLYPI